MDRFIEWFDRWYPLLVGVLVIFATVVVINAGPTQEQRIREKCATAPEPDRCIELLSTNADGPAAAEPADDPSHIHEHPFSMTSPPV